MSLSPLGPVQSRGGRPRAGDLPASGGLPAAPAPGPVPRIGRLHLWIKHEHVNTSRRSASGQDREQGRHYCIAVVAACRHWSLQQCAAVQTHCLRRPATLRRVCRGSQGRTAQFISSRLAGVVCRYRNVDFVASTVGGGGGIREEEKHHLVHTQTRGANKRGFPVLSLYPTNTSCIKHEINARTHPTLNTHPTHSTTPKARADNPLPPQM